MSFGSDLFTRMDEDATRPRLDAGRWYPAILVQGPTAHDALSWLTYNTGPDEKRGGVPKNTMTFKWNVLVNVNGESVWDTRKDLTTLFYWTYMARVIPPVGMPDDEVKSKFLAGQIEIDGNMSGALRALRAALFTNEELLSMGHAYPFDQFYGRVFNVEIEHRDYQGSPRASIKRVARLVDGLTGVIEQVSLDSVDWKPREEQEEAPLF